MIDRVEAKEDDVHDDKGHDILEDDDTDHHHKADDKDWDDGLGDIEWFVIDGVLYWNEEEDGMPDAWILYEIKNIANDEIKLEFKGVLKEDGTYDDYYSDLIGEIEVWTKLE